MYRFIPVRPYLFPALPSLLLLLLLLLVLTSDLTLSSLDEELTKDLVAFFNPAFAEVTALSPVSDFPPARFACSLGFEVSFVLASLISVREISAVGVESELSAGSELKLTFSSECESPGKDDPIGLSAGWV